MVFLSPESLMARILFLFLDGVGLGEDIPDRNPFAIADMPRLSLLLNGRRLLASSAPYEGELATLLAIDAQLDVQGAPQSASGQATILTGRNVPAEIGEHYGPKPNPPIIDILEENNLFMEIQRRGGTTALLNAYPPQYFESIHSRRRLYSAVPLAVTAAGLKLMTASDLQGKRAMSADFTGVGWAAQPDFPPAPIYSPQEAGALLATLSLEYDFAWFDYWITDYIGHRGTIEQGVQLIQTFDAILGGLVDAWKEREDLIIITSDHGNLEDLSQRGHTLNNVPMIAIGSRLRREQFVSELRSLTDFMPAILSTIFNPQSTS
jgi:hypothetical protein